MRTRLIYLVWLGTGSGHPTWQALGLTSRVLTVGASDLTDHSSGQALGVTSRVLPYWCWERPPDWQALESDHPTGTTLITPEAPITFIISSELVFLFYGSPNSVRNIEINECIRWIVLTC